MLQTIAKAPLRYCAMPGSLVAWHDRHPPCLPYCWMAASTCAGLRHAPRQLIIAAAAQRHSAPDIGQRGLDATSAANPAPANDVRVMCDAAVAGDRRRLSPRGFARSGHTMPID